MQSPTSDSRSIECRRIVRRWCRPPDPQLLGFLDACDRAIADLLLGLREIILEEALDASESSYRVYTVAIWFGFSTKMKNMFCYIGTNARHVNRGSLAALRCRIGIVCPKVRARRCSMSKFANEGDLEWPFLRRYIYSAIKEPAR
jgi:hypothetical protein